MKLPLEKVDEKLGAAMDDAVGTGQACIAVLLEHGADGTRVLVRSKNLTKAQTVEVLRRSLASVETGDGLESEYEATENRS